MVHVTWDGMTAPDGGAVDGYYVTRFADSTASNACGTNPGIPAGFIPAGTNPRSCDDTGVADGTAYKVTAVWRYLDYPRATRRAAGTVVVLRKVNSTTALVSSLNPSKVGDLVAYTATVLAGARYPDGERALLETPALRSPPAAEAPVPP